MKKFESGVTYYTRGTATIEICFPEDDVCCQNCRFCRSESDLKRYWCRLEERQIYSPFIDGVPDFCPIDFDGTKGIFEKE